MKHKTIVLGCGMVGATMARDLAGDENFDVTVADINDDCLARVADNGGIRTVNVDLSDPRRLRDAVKPFDLVVAGLPSVIGFQSLEAVIEAGKPYCDITFMPEDALRLDALAKEKGVTAVVDCGVSPGLSNMVIGYAHAQLDRTDRAEIYVGGLPKLRHWPFDYKAPFAPSDVLEEYTRPARLVQNGRLVTKPALSECELIDFPRTGTLEAFNTDGLRTLLATVNIPEMREKTLRYPGHAELMRALRETGFLDKTPMDINGLKVRPLDMTSRLLFAKWAFEPSEEEFTVMRVVVEGLKGDKRMRYTYDLYDEYDRATQTSSMARTTAFPNVIVARLVADGRFREPGVFPPEMLAMREGLFDQIVIDLNARGIHLTAEVVEV